MHEPSLFEVLRSPHGEDLVRRVKTAAVLNELEKGAAMREAVADALAWGANKAREYGPELIGAGAGAALGAGVGYATGKRHKKGQPSDMESHSSKKVREHEKETAALKSEKKPADFGHKMHGVQAEAYRGFAKAVAEHPVAGAAALAGFGALQGKSLGRFVANNLPKIQNLKKRMMG